MSNSGNTRTPILLWPFVAIWNLLTLVLNLVGRLICSVLGLVLMVAGVFISMTVLGAPIGVPLASFGFLLMIRALF